MRSWKDVWRLMRPPEDPRPLVNAFFIRKYRGSKFEVNYQLTRGFDNVQLRPTDTRHVHVFSNMKVER